MNWIVVKVLCFYLILMMYFVVNGCNCCNYNCYCNFDFNNVSIVVGIAIFIFIVDF